MTITRRRFVQGTALAAAGAAWMPRSIFAQAAADATSDRVLVVIFLRGGVDGLASVPPHAAPEYSRLRPNIALPQPKREGQQSIVDLDGFFGLHPELAPLKPLYDEKLLAVVHAVGSYALSRSHFQAQEFMETGSVSAGPKKGWLGQCVDCLPGDSLTKSAAFAPFVPRSVVGDESALVTADLGTFNFQAPGWRDEAGELLRNLYQSGSDARSRNGRDALTLIDILERNSALKAPPANGASYPDTLLGLSLRQAAQLIKAGLQTRCIFVNMESHFDTHANQVPSNAADLRDVGLSISGFRRDLGNLVDKTVVMLISEFGRTAAENGSRGTDHGSGGAMFLAGGPIAGGKVYGRWPGLAESQLYERRDLAVTTDFRDVFTEVAAGHLGVPSSKPLFPQYAPTGRLGLFRA